jgi:hypothetical protein
MASSDLGVPLPTDSVQVNEGPTRLYCLCKTTDENNMIGCDKCDEWYHFACVGIDQVTHNHFLTTLNSLPLLISITMSLFALNAKRRKPQRDLKRVPHQPRKQQHLLPLK